MSDTHTAVVDAREFYDAVANAALFASTDNTLPLITTVHICSPEPGVLRFEATNRYIASQEHLDLIDQAQDGQPSLASRDDIVRHLRDGHGDYIPSSGHELETVDDAWAEHNSRHANLQDASHTHIPLTTPATNLDIIVQVKGLLKITGMLKQLDTEHFGNVLRPRIMIKWTEGDRHASFTLTDRDTEPDQTLRAAVLDIGKHGKLYPQIGIFFDTYRDQRPARPGLEDPEPLELLPECVIASEWLAVLAKVATDERKPVVRLSLGLQTRPVIARIGSRFQAVIIPIKIAS